AVCKLLAFLVEDGNMGLLAVQVHTDVQHDRASFLSLANRPTLRRQAVSTGAEARSFMTSERRGLHNFR
ncbi:MAG: hypothetical protein ACYDCC_15230, partial [Actinomycetota bacterium]